MRGMDEIHLLGYLEAGKFEGITENERCATFDECFGRSDHLRAPTDILLPKYLFNLRRPH